MNLNADVNSSFRESVCVKTREGKNKGEGGWLDMSHTPQTMWLAKITNHVVSDHVV